MSFSEKVTFTNDEGLELAGRLEKPIGQPRAFAIFAHCFTCSKDIAAASRICRALAGRGIATLRFDFTGLGNSDGDFANTNFSSNIQDLVAAADFLRLKYAAPRLLVGHSLGGTAVLFAARQIPEVDAVATIGSPFDPGHVLKNFGGDLHKITTEGKSEVSLAGRTFTVKKQFIDDITQQDSKQIVSQLKKALLIFHSNTDDTVSIDNARVLFEAARHPKSFVSLDGASHLLSNAKDSQFVADILASWAGRYVIDDEPTPLLKAEKGEVIVTDMHQSYTQQIVTSSHEIVADEPTAVGGNNLGPNPYELLLSALGACTSMTMRMYANRKNWAIDQISVKLAHKKEHAQDCADCDDPKPRMIDIIDRKIKITADLSKEQMEKMFEIADKCPVHRTLENEIQVRTNIWDQ